MPESILAVTEALSDVRGAIYIPARAYNAPQMWRDYRPEETVRDFRYAQKVHLNALRLWMSFEYWRMDPEAHQAAYDHVLETASSYGIRVLPVLFECCGVQPSEEAMWSRDPLTAVCVMSPAREIVTTPDRWGEAYAFVDWFMHRYGSDTRQVAIEVMNEPASVPSLTFARAMFRRAAEQRGTTPLTVGAMRLLHNMYFMDLGLDVLQFHHNFPSSEVDARRIFQEAVHASRVLGKPVWCTEWQRIRRAGSGWDDAPVSKGELGPDYASLAPIVAEFPMGRFFWSLMVKPAYLPVQRRKGTINGLFNEDGSVWSLADARAISGDPELQLDERQDWPSWGPPRLQASNPAV